MNKNKKIELQQQIIETLSEENNGLKQKIEELEINLELERNLPKNKDYDIVKKLMLDLQSHIDEYDKLMSEIKKIRNGYITKSKEMTELEKKYKKNINNTIFTIKKGIK